MAYGVEAVKPIEMSVPTHTVSNYDVTTNDENLSTNLELSEEIRNEVDLRNEL